MKLLETFLSNGINNSQYYYRSRTFLRLHCLCSSYFILIIHLSKPGRTKIKLRSGRRRICPITGDCRLTILNIECNEVMIFPDIFLLQFKHDCATLCLCHISNKELVRKENFKINIDMANLAIVYLF